MDPKEMFIEMHEIAVEQYLEQHPDATEHEAYDATAIQAMQMMQDRVADAVDIARQLYKDRTGETQ